MQHWVIAGHGMVAMRLLQELVVRQPEAAITVVGEEPQGGYSRIGLSDVLAGRRTTQSLYQVKPDWFEQHGISRVEAVVLSVDRTQQQVHLSSGEALPYDRLILATGSRPSLPPVPGMDSPGVRPFRTLDDVHWLLDLPAGASAVVLGGGLLGLEAAAGLIGRGLDVTVIQRDPHLMNRQLDSFAAGWLQEALSAQGIRFETGMEAQAIKVTHDGRLSVKLADARWLLADAVIPAIGITPRVELAQACGLDTGRAIHVDDHLTTSDPAISALGECAEHRGCTYGLVAPLYEQARVLADHLTGGTTRFRGSAVATQLKVNGLPVFSAGDIDAGPDGEVIEWRDEAHREYRKLLLRQGRMIGAVLLGDIRDGAFYQDLIRQGTDISAVRDGLVFGAAFCGQLQQSAAASVPVTSHSQDNRVAA